MMDNSEMVEFEKAQDYFQILLDEPHPCDGCVNRDLCATGMCCSVYENYLYKGDITTSKKIKNAITGEVHYKTLTYEPHPMNMNKY